MEALYADPIYISTRFKSEALKRGFTKEQIADFLSKQEAPQLTRQKLPAAYYPIWGEPGTYQGDLVFIDKVPVLCVIDVNTRYAYAAALRSKEAGSVSDALSAILSTLRYPMVELQTDNGTEFLNAKINRLLKERGVNHTTVEPGNHEAQGMVERFNQTLRRLITLYANATGLAWKPVLEHLVDNYNHRVHSALGMAPADATDLDAYADKRAEQYSAAEKQFDRFKPGDTVRKLLNRGAFDKGAERWSHRIYTIERVEQHRFLLDDGNTARHYVLQKVHPDTTPLDVDAEEKLETKKSEGRKLRAQAKSGVEANTGEFDGEKYVGRRVRVPAWHFDAYKGNKEYALTFVGGTVASYKRGRGDPRTSYDWEIDWADGHKENANFAELEKWLIGRA